MLRPGVRGAIFVAIAWICLGIGLAQTLSFPPLSGRVVDEAGLLKAAERAALTETLAALEAKTTDQLVVATLTSLRGTDIADYGYRLGRHWGIGQKDKNNGALLIVVPSERQVRIEVGYGLEGTLTDALTRVIIETAILPRFRAGDFPGGIKAGVERIVQVLTGEADDLKRAVAGTASSDRVRSDEEPVAPIIVIVVLGVGLLIFCSITRGAICRFFLQILFAAMLSGGGSRSSGGSGSSFSGGGGSFGGGGSSGRW